MAKSPTDNILLNIETLRTAMRGLDDEQCGKLLKCIFYHSTKEEYNPNDQRVEDKFDFVQMMMDSYAERYKEKCEKLSMNGKKGGRPKKVIEEVDTESADEDDNIILNEKANGFLETNNKYNNKNIPTDVGEEEINLKESESEYTQTAPSSTHAHAEYLPNTIVNIKGKEVIVRGDKKLFVVPTIQEIQEWIETKGYHFDAVSFRDYYDPDPTGDASQRWKFRDGKPVKNWKQCCATFESLYKQRQLNKQQQQHDQSTDIALQQQQLADALAREAESRSESKMRVMRI